jgi:hypothetical protein
MCLCCHYHWQGVAFDEKNPNRNSNGREKMFRMSFFIMKGLYLNSRVAALGINIHLGQ